MTQVGAFAQKVGRFLHKDVPPTLVKEPRNDQEHRTHAQSLAQGLATCAGRTAGR